MEIRRRLHVSVLAAANMNRDAWSPLSFGWKALFWALDPGKSFIGQIPVKIQKAESF